MSLSAKARPPEQLESICRPSASMTRATSMAPGWDIFEVRPEDKPDHGAACPVPREGRLARLTMSSPRPIMDRRLGRQDHSSSGDESATNLFTFDPSRQRW
jgi:hypothetical protein